MPRQGMRKLRVIGSGFRAREVSPVHIWPPSHCPIRSQAPRGYCKEASVQRP